MHKPSQLLPEVPQDGNAPAKKINEFGRDKDACTSGGTGPSPDGPNPLNYMISQILITSRVCIASCLKQQIEKEIEEIEDEFWKGIKDTEEWLKRGAPSLPSYR